jgi:enamine deaminase RidA (YjgF/YER057c/UK114 family)
MTHVLQVLQPADWERPKGYSNGILARGRQVFVAGQVGWDGKGRFRSERMSDQVRQALENIVTILAEAAARPEHVVRLTWFITSSADYHGQLPEIGVAYRSVMGKHFPAMTVVQVAALIEAGAKVEIEATAVIPDPG